MNIPDIRNLLKHYFYQDDGTYRNEITPDLIEALFTHRLYKLFLPESLGGRALSIQDTLQVLQDAAYLNGSLGWLLQIGNGGMYFAANFDAALATELFAPANSLIAGSGTVNGTCTEINGGVTISGSWKYCSGADYASWFTVSVLRTNGTIGAAIVPRHQVTIIPDWRAIGLQHTSTHTIKLDHVFVPEQHLFNIMERKSFHAEKVFGLPFLVYAQAFFSSVAFGITERLLDEATKIALHKQALQQLIAEGRLLLNSAIKQSDQYIAEVLAGPVSTDTENTIQAGYKEMIKGLRRYAHDLHAETGMAGLYTEHAFTIFYLDLLAATQHKLLQ